MLAAVSLLTFYVNHFGAIMVLRISSEAADFRSFYFHFHYTRCLADSSCMVKAVQQHKDYQQQFQKKKINVYVLKIKLTLSYILTEFFMSLVPTYQCQIALYC